jgi:predicted RNA-binding Zn-ribbon protein involved in translation (DUF1610 family)
VNLNLSTNVWRSLSAVRPWLTFVAVVWLLGFVGLGWLVKSFLVLTVMVLLTPILAFVGLRWWLQRNLVQDQCPSCNFEFVGLNQTQTHCPNCNESVQIEGRRFQRLTPPGTIDVQAIEVASQVIED